MKSTKWFCSTWHSTQQVRVYFCWFPCFVSATSEWGTRWTTSFYLGINVGNVFPIPQFWRLVGACCPGRHDFGQFWSCNGFPFFLARTMPFVPLCNSNLSCARWFLNFVSEFCGVRCFFQSKGRNHLFALARGKIAKYQKQGLDKSDVWKPSVG